MPQYQSPYLCTIVILYSLSAALTATFHVSEALPGYSRLSSMFTLELGFVAAIITVVMAVISSSRLKHYQVSHISAY